ncbi:hypothetical protein YWA314_14002 [Yersinia enterocolitica subsp. enterocolitica WA-314]|nr:hypothetical protein YWA314_14002 [Yersinia enterocolitica subsp. enterocolitica WA-314]
MAYPCQHGIAIPIAGQDTQVAAQGSYQVTNSGPGYAREIPEPDDRSTQRQFSQSQHGSVQSGIQEYSRLSIPTIPPSTQALLFRALNIRAKDVSIL